jgi:hypothetical protein
VEQWKIDCWRRNRQFCPLFEVMWKKASTCADNLRGCRLVGLAEEWVTHALICIFFFFFVANFLYILISIMSSSFRRSLGAICRTFFVGCCVLISPFIYFIYFFNFISTLNTSHPHRIKILSGCFQSKKNPSFYTEDRIVISQGSSCIRSTQGCVVP